MATSLIDLDLCNDNFHQLPASDHPTSFDFTALRQFDTMFCIDDSPPLNVAGKTWGLLAKVLMGAVRLACLQNPLGYPIHFFHNGYRNQDAIKDFTDAYELLRNHDMPLERISLSPFENELRPFFELLDLDGGPDSWNYRPLNLIVLTATQSFDEYFDLERMVTQVTNDLRNKTTTERPIRIQICHVGYEWGTYHSLDSEQFFARLRVRPGPGNFERPVSPPIVFSNCLSLNIYRLSIMYDVYRKLSYLTPFITA
jgi:hypothetical protein